MGEKALAPNRHSRSSGTADTPEGGPDIAVFAAAAILAHIDQSRVFLKQNLTERGDSFAKF